MWPNPQEIADLVLLLKKSLNENFIFCVVLDWISWYQSFSDHTVKHFPFPIFKITFKKGETCR